ncbi:MAG: dynamin family protein [Pseudomonadota bacterium]
MSEALSAFDALEPFVDRVKNLDLAISPYAEGSDPAVAQEAKKLRKALKGFQPGITFVGQVKAGKSTLVNALAGWPGLLPADVNPWTSVVTSLHLSDRHGRAPARCAFRFFTNEEWANLIQQGGRVGEMASRAGAGGELSKVRAQLEEMRAKSQQRLGRRFQMLLGQTHSYETLDANLIKRYVCMGDDFWETAGGDQQDGQFADITKSADLWIPGPDLPLGLCIKDTPGVNDTFMIREQITLNALRGSRLCVMVLSAQQALSSVDLGLIRLISSIKSRDVVIFVNRIDELDNPAAEVPQIRASIEETLGKFGGPKEVEIIFGSALWAGTAAANNFVALGDAEVDTLMAWAEQNLSDDLFHEEPREIVWSMSGIPALGRALSDRIDAGSGTHLIEKTEAGLKNLKTMASTFPQMQDLIASGKFTLEMSGSELSEQIDQMRQQAIGTLSSRLSLLQEAFETRAHKSHHTFTNRATGELIKHLENYGENEVWTYDPVGLRMLLRTAFSVFARSAKTAATEEMTNFADRLSDVLQKELGLNLGTAGITPPPVPSAGAPIELAQTIALDLKGGWWTTFWRRRRGYGSFATDFAKLIFEETADMSEKLRVDSVGVYIDTLQRSLAEFVDDQRDLVLGMTSEQPAILPNNPSILHLKDVQNDRYGVSNSASYSYRK